MELTRNEKVRLAFKVIGSIAFLVALAVYLKLYIDNMQTSSRMYPYSI